jgi:hypothetical protein
VQKFQEFLMLRRGFLFKLMVPPEHIFLTESGGLVGPLVQQHPNVGQLQSRVAICANLPQPA